MNNIVKLSDEQLIQNIRQRAAGLQKKALAVELEEGFHRSSTNDDYYRGAADALSALADEMEKPSLVPTTKAEG